MGVLVYPDLHQHICHLCLIDEAWRLCCNQSRDRVEYLHAEQPVDYLGQSVQWHQQEEE
jgi:hypothetical protein